MGNIMVFGHFGNFFNFSVLRAVRILVFIIFFWLFPAFSEAVQKSSAVGINERNKRIFRPICKFSVQIADICGNRKYARNKNYSQYRKYYPEQNFQYYKNHRQKTTPFHKNRKSLLIFLTRNRRKVCR